MNGPQGAGQEGQRWLQAEGLVGCKQSFLGSLWDPVQNESVGPLFKDNEDFLTWQLQSSKPRAGPSQHRAPVADPQGKGLQCESSASSCVNRHQTNESGL